MSDGIEKLGSSTSGKMYTCCSLFDIVVGGKRSYDNAKSSSIIMTRVVEMSAPLTVPHGSSTSGPEHYIGRKFFDR